MPSSYQISRFTTALFLTAFLSIAMGGCGASQLVRQDTGSSDRSFPEGKRGMEEAETAMSRDEKAPGRPSTGEPTTGESGRRMVIYEASLKNSVNEIDPSIQKAKQVVAARNGRIEKQNVDQQATRASLVIRVPVERFTDCLDALSQIGTVVSRNIKADDITREFADLSQRLANRKQLLDRLYVILKRTKDTKQKIRILNEIARLNKEVESMEARRKHMAQKAAFSTIEVTFIARAKTSVNQGSSIPWLRNMRPDRRTLYGWPYFKFNLPSGFLDYEETFEDGGNYRFASPDGVQVRMATVENNPEADLDFFKRALEYERGRYPEEIESIETSANKIIMTTPQQVGYNTAYYTVILQVDGDDLHIAEIFYPNADVYKKNRGRVETSVKSMRPMSLLEVLWEML